MLVKNKRIIKSSSSVVMASCILILSMVTALFSSKVAYPQDEKETLPPLIQEFLDLTFEFSLTTGWEPASREARLRSSSMLHALAALKPEDTGFEAVQQRMQAWANGMPASVVEPMSHNQERMAELLLLWDLSDLTIPAAQGLGLKLFENMQYGPIMPMRWVPSELRRCLVFVTRYAFHWNPGSPYLPLVTADGSIVEDTNNRLQETSRLVSVQRAAVKALAYPLQTSVRSPNYYLSAIVSTYSFVEPFALPAFEVLIRFASQSGADFPEIKKAIGNARKILREGIRVSRSRQRDQANVSSLQRLITAGLSSEPVTLADGTSNLMVRFLRRCAAAVFDYQTALSSLPRLQPSRPRLLYHDLLRFLDEIGFLSGVLKHSEDPATFQSVYDLLEQEQANVKNEVTRSRAIRLLRLVEQSRRPLHRRGDGVTLTHQAALELMDPRLWLEGFSESVFKALGIGQAPTFDSAVLPFDPLAANPFSAIAEQALEALRVNNLATLTNVIGTLVHVAWNGDRVESSYRNEDEVIRLFDTTDGARTYLDVLGYGDRGFSEHQRLFVQVRALQALFSIIGSEHFADVVPRLNPFDVPNFARTYIRLWYLLDAVDAAAKKGVVIQKFIDGEALYRVRTALKTHFLDSDRQQSLIENDPDVMPLLLLERVVHLMRVGRTGKPENIPLQTLLELCLYQPDHEPLLRSLILDAGEEGNVDLMYALVRVSLWAASQAKAGNHHRLMLAMLADIVGDTSPDSPMMRLTDTVHAGELPVVAISKHVTMMYALFLLFGHKHRFVTLDAQEVGPGFEASAHLVSGLEGAFNYEGELEQRFLIERGGIDWPNAVSPSLLQNRDHVSSGTFILPAIREICRYLSSLGSSSSVRLTAALILERAHAVPPIIDTSPMWFGYRGEVEAASRHSLGVNRATDDGAAMKMIPDRTSSTQLAQRSRRLAIESLGDLYGRFLHLSLVIRRHDVPLDARDTDYAKGLEMFLERIHEAILLSGLSLQELDRFIEAASLHKVPILKAFLLNSLRIARADLNDLREDLFFDPKHEVGRMDYLEDQIARYQGRTGTLVSDSLESLTTVAGLVAELPLVLPTQMLMLDSRVSDLLEAQNPLLVTYPVFEARATSRLLGTLPVDSPMRMLTISLYRGPGPLLGW